MEEEDITDDLIPKVGLLVLNLSQRTAKVPCDSAFISHYFDVNLFLTTLSGMIYVDTLIDVLLRFSSRKSGGIFHDTIKISLFSIITVDVQSQ